MPIDCGRSPARNLNARSIQNLRDRQATATESQPLSYVAKPPKITTAATTIALTAAMRTARIGPLPDGRAASASPQGTLRLQRPGADLAHGFGPRRRRDRRLLPPAFDGNGKLRRHPDTPHAVKCRLPAARAVPDAGETARPIEPVRSSPERWRTAQPEHGSDRTRRPHRPDRRRTNRRPPRGS